MRLDLRNLRTDFAIDLDRKYQVRRDLRSPVLNRRRCQAHLQHLTSVLKWGCALNGAQWPEESPCLSRL